MDRLKGALHGANGVLGNAAGFLEFAAQLDARLARIESNQGQMAQGVNQIMALNQQESDAVAKLSTDIDAAVDAANTGKIALQSVVTNLNQQLSDLQSKDDADQTQVAALTKNVADLQAVIDGNTTDVLGALSGVDQHVQSLGGGSTASATTTPAPTTTTTTTPSPAPSDAGSTTPAPADTSALPPLNPSGTLATDPAVQAAAQPGQSLADLTGHGATTTPADAGSSASTTGAVDAGAASPGSTL